MCFSDKHRAFLDSGFFELKIKGGKEERQRERERAGMITCPWGGNPMGPLPTCGIHTSVQQHPLGAPVWGPVSSPAHLNASLVGETI